MNDLSLCESVKKILKSIYKEHEIKLNELAHPNAQNNSASKYCLESKHIKGPLKETKPKKTKNEYLQR